MIKQYTEDGVKKECGTCRFFEVATYCAFDGPHEFNEGTCIRFPRHEHKHKSGFCFEWKEER